MVEIGDGDQQVSVPKNLLRRVQGQLQQKGFYNGGVDGLYGQGTASAIRAYQQQNGLDATGIPNWSTVVHILGSGTQ